MLPHPSPSASDVPHGPECHTRCILSIYWHKKVIKRSENHNKSNHIDSGSYENRDVVRSCQPACMEGSTIRMRNDLIYPPEERCSVSVIGFGRYLTR